MPLLRVFVAAAASAAILPAQLTVADGNMSATLGALSPTAQTPTSLALRADALATNHGYEHAWYYRVTGDTRELTFRDVGGVTGGNPSPDHGDRDWNDVDARGLLKASLDVDTYDAGPASGVVISRLTLMNRSNAPVTFDLFCYTDLDIAGSSGNDTVIGTASRHFVSDPTGVQVEVRAVGADLSAVDAYPTIRNQLTDLDVDNLSGSVPPFNGDYTGAFQWQSRTLAPFEVRTFQVLFAVDTAAVADPLVELYGAGNGSTFEIQTPTVPLQDNTQPRVLTIQMKGALPFVEQRTVIGLDPTTPFPFIPGLDFWVLPASIFAVYGAFTDANGTAQESFIIPAAPYFAGFSVYFQVFSVDGAAPNGFAYFSPGLRVRIGKL